MSRGGPDVIATWLDGPDGVVTKPSEPALPLAAINVTPTDPNIVLRGRRFPRRQLRRFGADRSASPARRRTELARRAWAVQFAGVLPGAPVDAELFRRPVGRRRHPAPGHAGAASRRRLRRPARARSANSPTSNMRLYYSGDRSQAALSNAPQIIGRRSAASLERRAVHGAGHRRSRRGNSSGMDHVQRRRQRHVDAARSRPVRSSDAGGSTPTRLRRDRRLARVEGAARQGAIQSQIRRAGGERHLASSPSTTTSSRYYGVGAVVAGGDHDVALVSPPAGATIGATVNVKATLAFGGVALANKPVLIGIGGVAHAGVTGNDGSARLGCRWQSTPATI